jgi:simple sugar transport system ATP-binding protein
MVNLNLPKRSSIVEDHVTGSIVLGSKEIVGLSVHQSLLEGIAFVPESREDDGLITFISLLQII